MTKAITIKSNLAALENILIKGDLAGFNEKQRLTYVKALCKATGVSILFQPFDYITYQGKMVIYAKRACTEQLRAIHSIHIRIVSRENKDGLISVVAQGEITRGKMKGRIDESIGCVNSKGLSGKELANAPMIAETKAKRRMTLSICGLGFLDELEIQELVKAENRLVTEMAVEETAQIISETTKRPEFETERPAPSMEQAAPHSDPGLENEYTIKTIRGLKGKRIIHCPLNKLAGWLATYDRIAAEGSPLSPEVQDESIEVRAFLEAAQLTKPDLEEVPNGQ
jgi:hypothetical protein